MLGLDFIGGNPIGGIDQYSPLPVEWLADVNAARVVLVEVAVRSGGVETVRYLSSRPYVTGAADSPAHTAYLPLLQAGVAVTERLALDGSPSLAFGDIEIDNTGGQYDGWLDDIWSGRPLRAYLGDLAWPRAEFRLIFDGVVDDIASRGRNVLNLVLRDKLQRLNGPVTEDMITVTVNGTSTEYVTPLTFGECHNIEPLLLSAAQLQYQFHGGPIESIIEVRDNGVPVAYADNGQGKFTLLAQPAGQVTASVQGDKTGGTWRVTVAPLIRHLVTAYGRPDDRFTDADIDLANFDEFDDQNYQAVGLHLPERDNVIDVVNRLAQSVGAAAYMGRQGRLRLVLLALPPATSPTVVTHADMEQGTLELADRLPVSASVKIGYCRNWTVQNNLQTGIPQEHKDLFKAEWLYATQADADVASQYRLHQQPAEEGTLLLRREDALVQAQRRLYLRKTPRLVVRFTGYAPLMQLQLGDALHITHWRFGLAQGKAGLVVGLAVDWLKSRVTVEVLI